MAKRKRRPRKKAAEIRLSPNRETVITVDVPCVLRVELPAGAKVSKREKA